MRDRLLVSWLLNVKLVLFDQIVVRCRWAMESCVVFFIKGFQLMRCYRFDLINLKIEQLLD